MSLLDVFAYSKDLVFAVGIEGVICHLGNRLRGFLFTAVVLLGCSNFRNRTGKHHGCWRLGTVQRFIPYYDALGEEPPTILEEVEEVEESEEEASGDEANTP